MAGSRVDAEGSYKNLRCSLDDFWEALKGKKKCTQGEKDEKELKRELSKGITPLHVGRTKEGRTSARFGRGER